MNSNNIFEYIKNIKKNQKKLLMSSLEAVQKIEI